MIFAAIYAHGVVPLKNALEAGGFAFPVLFYLIVFAVIMLAGALVRRPGADTSVTDTEEEKE